MHPLDKINHVHGTMKRYSTGIICSNTHRQKKCIIIYAPLIGGLEDQIQQQILLHISYMHV